MATEPSISIQRVKYTARQQLAQNLVGAIKINIFAIIQTMLRTWALVAAMLLSWWVTIHPDLALNSGSNHYLLSVMGRAVYLLVSWSTLWTIIDQFQQPKQPVKFRRVFQVFTNGSFMASFLLALVQQILIFLWSLCFFIPGVVKYFSYSQAYYAYKMDLLFHRRQKSLTDYLTISRRVMTGQKGTLFQLEVSFIGWHLLGILTLGLAYIYIIPYLYASRVVFSSQVFNQAVGRSQS